jgi:hypothetical protein
MHLRLFRCVYVAFAKFNELAKFSNTFPRIIVELSDKRIED